MPHALSSLHPTLPLSRPYAPGRVGMTRVHSVHSVLSPLRSWACCPKGTGRQDPSPPLVEGPVGPGPCACPTRRPDATCGRAGTRTRPYKPSRQMTAAPVRAFGQHALLRGDALSRTPRRPSSPPTASRRRTVGAMSLSSTGGTACIPGRWRYTAFSTLSRANAEGTMPRRPQAIEMTEPAARPCRATT
jgi:hypothetical protein